MHFTKLRLTGFKSFVDRTELDIAPGLTGVVGPNGCGKSNLVEALRWTMGEASAKQMRGGEMNDVIFGGTDHRPARDIAEVALKLDNSSRTAPAEFNDGPELEISRRIERDLGSQYRINGREVRAKDVQILFADLATGSRSTALVSQGRVAALINAKPAGRRLLLEEAAGITGLHTRRHEAELKLRAAETNLERLDDVVVALEVQLDGLKKQARQAKRYRSLSDRLRETEAIVLHHRWHKLDAAVRAAEATLKEADDAVTEQTRKAATAATDREKSAAVLGPLRDTEAQSAAGLQRLTLAGEALDAEARRNMDAQALTESRLAQIGDDHIRETILEKDAVAAFEALAEAIAEIEALGEDATATLATTQTEMEAANARAESTDQDLAARTEAVATDEASRAGLIRQIDEIAARIEDLNAKRKAAHDTLNELADDIVSATAIAAAEQALADTRAQLETARSSLAEIEHQRIDAEAKTQTAREARQQAREHRGQLAAEAQALIDLLSSDKGGDDTGPAATPVLDRMTVSPGFEIALGAALGADLDAPVAEPAGADDRPRQWRPRNGGDPVSGPKWPPGVEPLGRHVQGPEALALAISHIGVVADRATGDRLAGDLAPGQSLVSRDGDFWRWDGFGVGADALPREAALLRQRNRLGVLEKELTKAARAATLSDEAYDTATGALATIRETEARTRDQAKSGDNAHAAAGARHADILRRAAEQSSRLEGLKSAVERFSEDLKVDGTRREERAAELAGLDDPEIGRTALETARKEAGAARAAQREATAVHDATAREIETRRQRRATMENERESWNKRRQGAATRIAELAERRQSLVTEKQALAAQPAEIEQRRSVLLDSLAAAEKQRGTAADALAAAERVSRDHDTAARTADASLAEARESRVRAESETTQAAQARQTVAERIAERLDCAPEAALETVGLDPEKSNLPDFETAERRLERLLRERDNMGPVNLRAEQEAEELAEQIDTMRTEREDLTAAIARLRQGISGLNREARQRLLASFQDVDTHFQELFKHLFGGGSAHLELIEADDPLEAGLEIYASPPGKKLQALSLLSGGEQALTALALLFGVFLTNPAPICVLDEVDAPLDDANVDRFCNLLDRIVERTQTRFLLVTHHRMTMARMDRLYGVTMTERGVSQLVSVDLQQAEELRQTA